MALLDETVMLCASPLCPVLMLDLVLTLPHTGLSVDPSVAEPGSRVVIGWWEKDRGTVESRDVLCSICQTKSMTFANRGKNL